MGVLCRIPSLLTTCSLSRDIIAVASHMQVDSGYTAGGGNVLGMAIANDVVHAVEEEAHE